MTTSIDEVKSRLAAHSLALAEEKRLPNDTGTQLKLQNGAIVNVFDKGTISVQGKNQDAVKNALAISNGATAVSVASVATNNKVFVVYGHDETARNQLDAMLRRWGLDPLILDQLPSEGQTIIEKLEKYTGQVNYAVVLATPDDEGHKSGREDEKAYRARQNVVLELGMMLAQLGRSRVAVLMKQVTNMERPSDIQGLIYIPFKDNLQREAGALLAKEMAAQGYSISVEKL